MSLIDDLKEWLSDESIDKKVSERIIHKISEKHGGEKKYIRKRKLGLTFKNQPEQNKQKFSSECFK